MGMAAQKETPVAAIFDKKLAFTVDRLSAGETQRRHWVLDVPSDTTKETIFNPKAWAGLSSRIGDFDLVEIRSDNKSFWALLIVLRANPAALTVEVSELLWKEFKPIEGESVWSDGYYSARPGRLRTWEVVRIADNVVMNRDLPNLQAARHIITNDLKPTF